MQNCDRDERGETSQGTATSTGAAHAASCDRLPRIVLFGGQDAPTTEQLIRRWQVSPASELAAHHLSVMAWPKRSGLETRDGLRRTHVVPGVAVQTTRTQPVLERRGALDRTVAGIVSSAVRRLERHMACNSGGEPRDLASHVVYHYTRFSVDALYDRDGWGRRLIELAIAALVPAPSEGRTPPLATLVIAHSFGGTLALRAAWELARTTRASDPRFHLITLGTACGPMVVRSPMFAQLPRERGLIVRPMNVLSWQHFHSDSDALVAAPALPQSFAGVSLCKVDTGPFLARGRGHALTRYLRAPAVLRAIDALLRARPLTVRAPVPLASRGADESSWRRAIDSARDLHRTDRACVDSPLHSVD